MAEQWQNSNNLVQFVEFQEEVAAGPDKTIPAHVPIPVVIESTESTESGFSSEQIIKGLILFFSIGEESPHINLYRDLALYINPFLQDFLLKQGGECAMNQEKDYAEFYFRALVGFNPSSLEGHFNLGLLYSNWNLEVEDFEEKELFYQKACYYLERCLELQIDFIDPCFHLGYLYFEMGDFTKSAKMLSRYIEKSEHPEKVKRAQSLMKTIQLHIN